jgi:two-component system cell cycle sensor histidine kinase/response regulator CckA
MPRTRVAETLRFPGLEPENRLVSRRMSEAGFFEDRTIARTAPKRSAIGQGFVVLTVLLVLGGTALMGLFASSTTSPVILTLLCLLAAAGVFFCFGVVAGHIRLAERTTETDLMAGIFDSVDHGLIVTRGDGLVYAANAAASELVCGAPLAPQTFLESAFRDQPSLNAALFRLSRATARGLARVEDVYLEPQALPGLSFRGGRWLRITAKPIDPSRMLTSDTALTAWSIIDITRDRSAAEQTSRQLERQLHDFRQMPAGFLVVGGDETIAQVNEQLSDWLGLSQASRGREPQLSDIVSRDGIEMLRAVMSRPDVTQRTIELDLITEDGFTWPATVILSRGETLADTTLDTSISGFRAVVLPRAENATASAETTAPFQSSGNQNEGLARLFRSAPFGIATVTPEGMIAERNAAFTRLLLDIGEAPTKRALDVLAAHATPETRAEIETALGNVLAGRANIPPVEIAIGEDQGQTRRLFFGAGSRTGASGELAVVYVIDATEEKALEHKFAQSQKMEVVGKLAGGVAHDFNNVMTAIIGFSDLLLGTHRPGDPGYQHLKNIKSSAVRAADLVRNLLAFSRQQQLQPQVLNPQEVVTDISAMLNRTLGEKVDLDIRSERDLWFVKADKNELERVIVNLAVNARDAMPEGGRLSVRTRNVTERESARLKDNGLVVGEYVLIEVEDTGVGMPAEVLDKVFEPFFTTKGIGRGTGLGLSTVYGIVKQTGGFIYPSSTPGKGTTFRVYLPRHDVAQDDAEAKPKPAGERPPHRDLTGSGRVLLVEDEDAVRLFATQALKRLGYEVFQAADGYEALDLFDEPGFGVDLIVSDVKMPEMDGPTLLKELRKTQPDLKFVFVSGYPADAFSKTLADETNYTFLPKPYSLEQIAEIVKDQIEAPAEQAARPEPAAV